MVEKTMAYREDQDTSGNAYKCKVTLLTSPEKSHILHSSVASIMDWVDPSRQLIDVKEHVSSDRKRKKMTAKKGLLICPAISVILFMREYDGVCVKDIQKLLKKPPWKFHHKVDLQNKRTPKTVVASQEFYELSRDLPLFAACPVLTETEIIRIQLYVRNFTTMVEFYRTITEIEIETSKPDFCIFELYKQPNLAVQLSLKRCQYIHPVPLKSAYISFNIKSISDFQLTTSAITEHVTGNVFTTHDPDGNLVILYERCKALPGEDIHESAECAIDECNPKMEGTLVLVEEAKSVVSAMESLDSGQVSDMEEPARGLEKSFSNQLTIVNPSTKDNINDVQDRSEGYVSSDAATSETLTIDKPAKVRTNGARETKGSSICRNPTFYETNSLPRRRPGSCRQKQAFSAPIYI